MAIINIYLFTLIFILVRGVFLLVNIIGFNIAWCGLVYWGDVFIPVAIIILVSHIIWFSKPNEVLLIIVVSCIGILIDSLLMHINIFIFPNASYIPYWLITLWFCFSATLLHSLRILSQSRWYQVLVGFGIAPCSYLMGEKLGVVNFGYSIAVTFTILGIIWAALLVLCFYLSSILNKEADCV